ncbi:MAG: hypothetical protein ABUS56_05795 [Acidobacteriota bacterium]
MRRNLGIALLAASVVYSAVDLSGVLRPMFLRMRAHPGPGRTAAVAVGSITFKAAILAAGALLAFWPERSHPPAP